LIHSQIKHLSRAIRELQEKVDRYEAMLQSNSNYSTVVSESFNSVASAFLSPVKSFAELSEDEHRVSPSPTNTTTDNSLHEFAEDLSHVHDVHEVENAAVESVESVVV